MITLGPTCIHTKYYSCFLHYIQYPDRSGQLLASCEPELWRVEVRDRRAKAGGPRGDRDGQDDFPRVNLRLQCPHPGTEVNRPYCSAIDVLPLSQRLSPYVLEYSFAFQMLSPVSYFHRVRLYLCCLLGIPVSYIHCNTARNSISTFFRTCWR